MGMNNPIKDRADEVLQSIWDATANAIRVTGMIVPTRLVKNAFANVPASQTNYNLVSAVAGKKIRVLSAVATAGATATDLTFNSNATAISCLFSSGAHGGFVLPRGGDDTSDNGAGWFETVAGQPLTCTTGAGSPTGLQLKYCEV